MKSLRGSTDWFRMEGLRLKKMNMKKTNPEEETLLLK
jgi:hypothetical protein